MIKLMHATFIFSLLFSFHSVSANEVKEAINDAQKSYAKGELSEATTKLNYASSLIRQEKSQLIIKALPKPLAGWEEDEADLQDATMLAGQGMILKKSYYTDSSEVKIEVISDSPMMVSSFSMMMDPAIVVSSGGKILNIKGNKASLTKENGGLKLMFIIDNKMIYSLQSSNTSDKAIIEYAKASDFSQLKSL